ncbi:SOS response-associated peptidase [Deinococcus cellulosilyticus]|uniref:Abasic site processing protein n=1 Tax=Deinococcus cellulosilyticus (strain DSM 18568 / NBRC 106333 / KACC 11606 / 5516J-15) TaxID=1223518 RepID=A0A511N672_DEIC1|nr:SOS response-associated peptidase [Deinococcus cellulosilyticus]GEM48369.1 DUF159 family protein [Deinococcus cellulosilyticus NBRC 106333 = KACC 11606]
MCGRITGHHDGHFIWNIKYHGPWNFARELRPTEPYPIIRKRPGTDELEALSARWGLIPSFCQGEEDLKKFKLTFNARSETAHTLPSYRRPFQTQRCLVQISNFVEWKRDGKRKEKFLFSSASGGPLIVAGLWDFWMGKEGLVHSFTLLTCPPNKTVSSFHDRMPVILGQASAREWLEQRTVTQLQTLLRPCPSSWLTVTPADPVLVAV